MEDCDWLVAFHSISIIILRLRPFQIYIYRKRYYLHELFQILLLIIIPETVAASNIATSILQLATCMYIYTVGRCVHHRCLESLPCCCACR
jgi:thiaminase